MKASYIPYLILNDYLTTIRSDQLNNQLLDAVEQGGEFERKSAESFALDEVRSKLGSYFYLDFEFRPTLSFNFKKKYYAGDRVVLDFPDWVAGSEIEDGVQVEDSVTSNSYSIGDCIILDTVAYSCTKENSDLVFDESNWIKIGNQYDIYFVNFPYDIFQLVPSAQIGIETPGLYSSETSKVCWLKKLYLCRNNTWIIGHQAREQYYEINSFPSPNMFPNQIDSAYSDGNRQWIDKGEFYFKGVLPNYPPEVDIDLNESADAWSEGWIKSWTLGDNRSDTMKQIVISIAIAKLLSRNTFMLKERSINRDWAYSKLERIRKGEDTTLIPILQPEQVGDISHGGMPKVRNTF